MSKKILKPLIAGIVVAAVAVSAIFCCCIGTIAQAHSIKSTTASASCHGDQSTHQKDSKPCNCALTKIATADTMQLSAINTSSIFNVFYPHEAMMAIEQGVRLSSVKIDYGGAPPGQFRSVPLYLQNRSLRL